ncbi:hypothetical protein G9A89_017482 [Geosiphon pyriformis]|nr:hypothetical protein G9A89_017482 [Geosiphon pyriformis]
MGDYSYLSQQSKEHFKAHNKNNLDFIELNSLPSCLICFPIEEQSTETYTAYTTYYFDQAYFEDNFEEKNNSINQLLYFATFEQQLPNFEYLNYQIYIWIAAHQTTETPFETEEKSYQTAPVFDFLLSKSDSSTQTVTLEPMANDPMQGAVTANQYNEKYKFQIVGGYLQGFSAIWFSQETDVNAQHRIIRWTSTNAGEENTSFTIQFEAKFRTPILISKWHMELKRRIQGPGKVVTEYAKVIRKLIKRTEEQKIHSFIKGLRTDLLMHLGSTLSVFAPASVMAPAPQMTAPKLSERINNSKDPNLNSVLINPSNPYIKDNKIIVHLDCNNSPLPSLAPRNNDNQNNRISNNNVPNQRPNHANINFFGEDPLVEATSESASQPKENLFFAFNLTNDNHDMDELAINTSESTRKKKKTKVDFVLDPNKVSTSTANNNKPPKAKVFKNPPKLEPPEIVQKSGPYSVVKDFMKTPAHITFGQLMTHPQFRKDFHKSLILKKKTPKTNKRSRQAELADNSNVTPLICKAQVAGYFIDLILDSESSVSKKDLGIAKAIPVHINGISIETDIEVSEAKEYTIIVGNEWLKKAKVLLNYELCELTIRCGKKSIVVKCRHWTTPPATKQNQEDKQSKKSDDEESDEENE